VKDHRCVSGSAEAADDLRVSFYSVREQVVGNLVMGMPHPDIDQIFAKVRFVENDVYRETKDLFARFGTSRTYQYVDDDDVDSWTISINDSEDKLANIESSSKKTASPVKLWYLSPPYTDMLSDRMFVRSASQAILQTDHWPAGYSMDYQGCKAPHFISCTS